MDAELLLTYPLQRFDRGRILYTKMRVLLADHRFTDEDKLEWLQQMIVLNRHLIDR